MSLLIDIGSTYFKVCSEQGLVQHFRDFDKNIYDDLLEKCGDTVGGYAKEDIFICSSANGGLSTLIIGLTESFSIKYATNIAFNSGINIIDTVLYSQIEHYTIPSETIDVVIVVGGIDSVANIFDQKLIDYLKKINYHNIVYVGSEASSKFVCEQVDPITYLGNIVSNKLKMEEDRLKEYLTHLYQKDIIGKEDIKHLYDLTSNQIFSTPYIVNQTLPLLGEQFADVVDPFLVIDTGGATTDIHYSRDLIEDNIITDSEYDRLVFKKLGVYKSRESLIHSAKQNEFVYELLAYLGVTEDIFEQHSDRALKVLMQLSIFLVLFKVSLKHNGYINLKLEKLESIVLTGGITKVLSDEDIGEIMEFFYKKILSLHHIPKIVVDKNYEIWTLGVEHVDQ
jgi:hypothetical protein